MKLDLLYDKLALVALPLSITTKMFRTDAAHLVRTSSIHIDGLCSNDFGVTISTSSNSTDLRVVIGIPGANNNIAYTLGESFDVVLKRIPSNFQASKYFENIIIIIQSLEQAYQYAFKGAQLLQSPFEIGMSDDDITAATMAYNDDAVKEEDRLKNTFGKLKKAHTKFKNDRFFMGFYNSICGRLNKLGICYYDL